MSLHKYLERIKYVDHLIRKRSTGNIENLARKLQLSKSGAEKFLREMKEVGFPIAYNKKRKTYYYTEEGKVYNKLFEKETGREEMKKITGGVKIFQNFFKT
jgi:predicted transcriptional regulator